MLGHCCGEGPPPIPGGWRHASVLAIVWGYNKTLTQTVAPFNPIPVDYYRIMRRQHYRFTDSLGRVRDVLTTFPQQGTAAEANSAYTNPVVSDTGALLTDTTPWSTITESADQLTLLTQWFTNAGMAVVHSSELYEWSMENSIIDRMNEAVADVTSIDLRAIPPNMRIYRTRNIAGQLVSLGGGLVAATGNGSGVFATRASFAQISTDPPFVWTEVRRALYVSETGTSERLCVVGTDSHPAATTSCIPPPLVGFEQDRTFEVPMLPPLVTMLGVFPGVGGFPNTYQRKLTGYIMGQAPTPPACCNAVPPP